MSNQNSIEDKDLIKEAKQKIELFDYRKSEIQERDLQVFLLQYPAEVNFGKSSDGGFYSSKKYLRNIAREYPSAFYDIFLRTPDLSLQ